MSCTKGGKHCTAAAASVVTGNGYFFPPCYHFVAVVAAVWWENECSRPRPGGLAGGGNGYCVEEAAEATIKPDHFQSIPPTGPIG